MADGLESRIARLAASAGVDEIDGYADQQNAEQYEGEGEDVEEIEEVEEMQLLAMLDAECDPLKVCRTIVREDSALASTTILSAADLTLLVDRGYVILDEAMPADVAFSAGAEAFARMDRGELCSAGQLKRLDEDPFRDTRARTDFVQFISDRRLERNTPLGNAMATVEAIHEDLLKTMSLDKTGDEYQLAVYIPGGAYERHRDALPEGVRGSGGAGDLGMPPQRKITCVFYLGDRADFDPNAAGGELRLYPSPEGGGGSVDVAPLPGRVVIFFSGAVDHEVRTTRTRRAALTLWAR